MCLYNTDMLLQPTTGSSTERAFELCDACVYCVHDCFHSFVQRLWISSHMAAAYEEQTVICLLDPYFNCYANVSSCSLCRMQDTRGANTPKETFKQSYISFRRCFVIFPAYYFSLFLFCGDSNNPASVFKVLKPLNAPHGRFQSIRPHRMWAGNLKRTTNLSFINQ